MRDFSHKWISIMFVIIDVTLEVTVSSQDLGRPASN